MIATRRRSHRPRFDVCCRGEVRRRSPDRRTTQVDSRRLFKGCGRPWQGGWVDIVAKSGKVDNRVLVDGRDQISTAINGSQVGLDDLDRVDRM